MLKCLHSNKHIIKSYYFKESTMLNSYKKVSIIYGGTGKEYATQIRNELNRLHLDEHYPLYVNDLNTDWVGNNILGEVVDAIKNSDLIYIVFTLDDIGASKKTYEEKGESSLKGRLRQNVLIELGMALVVLGDNKNNIRIVANFAKTDLGDDFPSDIRDSFSIREFKDDHFDEVLVAVGRHIREEFGIQPTTNVLHEENVKEDFENVFEEFSGLNLFKDTKVKSLNDILSLWLPAIRQFTFPEERLLYCLERIKALPIFGNGPQLVDWMRKFRKESIIQCDFDHPDRRFIDFVQDIVAACFEYTIIKTDDATENNYDEYKSLVSEFKMLENRYKEYLSQGVKIRPIIGFMLNEYYGLTLMRLIKIKSDYEYADKAIEEFEECLKLAKIIDTDFKLYRGYASFNLGRAYYYRFLAKGDKADKERYLDYMNITVRIRREWKEADGFIQCYSNALSYEYFYASSEFVVMKKETSEIDETEYRNNLKRIIDEIDGYICKDSELLKLYKVKQRCIKLNK